MVAQKIGLDLHGVLVAKNQTAQKPLLESTLVSTLCTFLHPYTVKNEKDFRSLLSELCQRERKEKRQATVVVLEHEEQAEEL